MHVTCYAQSWDLGGPMVVHSPWWIRAHWGRLFEIIDLRPSGFGSQPGHGHGTVVMRKREQACTVEALEAPEPDEPREAIALAHNRRRLFAEIAALRAQQGASSGELADARAQIGQMEAARGSAGDRRLGVVLSDRTKHALASLRRAAGRLRRGRAEAS